MNTTRRLDGVTTIDCADVSTLYLGGSEVVDVEYRTIDAKAVTAAKLGADVAGKGLTGGDGAAIALDGTKFHGVLAAGTDVDTEVVVSGMAVGDRIVSVFAIDFTGGAITDVTSQYTAAAGKMTKVGADSQGKTLMISFIDLT